MLKIANAYDFPFDKIEEQIIQLLYEFEKDYFFKLK